jgi:hypothetical protein
LILFHRPVATRDCSDCLLHIYNEETGKREEFRGGPVKRIKASPPPCRTAKGCAKGTPESPNTLSRKNLLAYEHYQECKAVGAFPDDAIVRRNARVIRELEDAAERVREAERLAAMFGVASLRRG